jgi:hypothetical protein
MLTPASVNNLPGSYTQQSSTLSTSLSFGRR